MHPARRKRIIDAAILADELRSFEFCAPDAEPPLAEMTVAAFKELAQRFVFAASRIDNPEIARLISLLRSRNDDVVEDVGDRDVLTALAARRRLMPLLILVEEADAEVGGDLIPGQLRLALREHLVRHSTLQRIHDVFKAAGVVLGADPEQDLQVGGQRRTLIEQYYGSLDFTSDEDEARLLKILTSVVQGLAYASGLSSIDREVAHRDITQHIANNGFCVGNGGTVLHVDGPLDPALEVSAKATPRASNAGFSVSEPANPGQRNMMTMKSQNLKILLVAANPLDTDRLALDEEVREIRTNLRAADHRDRFSFATRLAGRPNDLRQGLLEERPTVLHFCGHGSGSRGLVFHGPSGDVRAVSAEAFRSLVGLFTSHLRIVVLNACYSEVQARAVAEVVDFVVGMNNSVGDDEARTFSGGFYSGLAFGRTVQDAFELGRSAVAMEHGTDGRAHEIPTLLEREPGTAIRTELIDTLALAMDDSAPPVEVSRRIAEIKALQDFVWA